MYGFDDRQLEEEALREIEMEEAERMVRNGASMRQIRRKQFFTLQPSDIYKMYRKFGILLSQFGTSPLFHVQF